MLDGTMSLRPAQALVAESSRFSLRTFFEAKAQAGGDGMPVAISLPHAASAAGGLTAAAAAPCAISPPLPPAEHAAQDRHQGPQQVHLQRARAAGERAERHDHQRCRARPVDRRDRLGDRDGRRGRDRVREPAPQGRGAHAAGQGHAADTTPRDHLGERDARQQGARRGAHAVPRAVRGARGQAQGRAGGADRRRGRAQGGDQEREAAHRQAARAAGRERPARGARRRRGRAQGARGDQHQVPRALGAAQRAAGQARATRGRV